MSSQTLREAAEASKAWPFEEARKLIARLERSPRSEVIFETGYGPSGLPHIGTFGEVARTTMVRHAFRVLTGDSVKTRLIAFSDDMDGLRKIPDNIPNRELIAAHLGKPLTQVPDPFGEYDSFAAHNNARLRALSRPVRLRLRVHVVDRDLSSRAGSTRRSSAHARTLRRGAGDHAAVAARGAGGDLFALPADPPADRRRHAGAGASAHDAEAGTIRWRDPDTDEEFETPVTGGKCKLQWKPDWAMRWHALGVDYEMAGKDLIDSVKLSSRIARALGRRAAGRLQLRALPRRERAEDLEVEGQRPDDRGMAGLCQPGEPVALHVPEADRRRSGSISTSSRAMSTTISAFSTPIRDRSGRSGSAIRSGTSMPASRPRRRS